ncbi:Uncharacterized protein Adt_35002 [Abeliophyllum distichum]|uniref:Uncharacterized protein n=1 Tax=Abeliophyllum distichum TaxID=126358 RepID=A0ABD1QHJ0_9LAMI
MLGLCLPLFATSGLANMWRTVPGYCVCKARELHLACMGMLDPYSGSDDILCMPVQEDPILQDFSSNGSLSTKTIVEALELFERMDTTTAMKASDRAIHNRTIEVH